MIITLWQKKDLKMSKIEKIEDITRRIYDAILTSCPEVICLLIKELDAYIDFDLKPLYTTHRDETVRVLLEISRILQHEFTAFSIKTEKETVPLQTIRSEKLRDFFDYIIDKNIHSAEKDGNLYKCDHHQESLFSHLVMAMLVAIASCVAEVAIEDIVVVGFTALIHDIGKLSTLRLIDGKKKITTFQAHGEVGGLIFTRISNSFAGFFNDAQIYAIARCLTVHMCGYHCTDFQSSITELKMCYLCQESDYVKMILTHLRLADAFGKQSEKSSENNQVVMSTREDFSQAMFGSKIPLKQKFNGAVISVTGQSGCGKTTVSEMISKMLFTLGYLSIVLSRDMCTMFLMAQIAGSPIEFGYVPDGEGYKNLYDNYRSKEHGKAVNDLFLQKLTEYLHKGFIVILDTQATMFGNKYNPHIMDRLKRDDIFIIVIICSRNADSALTQADADRRGLTLEEQLIVIGEMSTFSPLPKTINLNTIESSFAKNPDERACYKPHVVLPVSWFAAGLPYFLKDVEKWIKFSLGSSSIPDVLVLKSDPIADSDESCIQWLQRLFDESDRNIDNFGANLRLLNITLAKRYATDKSIVYHVTYIDGKCKEYGSYIPRHVIFGHNLETDELFIMRYIMPRGPEALSTNNIENGITSNESMSRGKTDHFPLRIQRILHDFTKPKHSDLKLDLSFKVDGSILCLQYIFNRPIRDAYTSIMMEAGGIHSTLVEKCKDLPYLLVISTSGTHLISKMLGYFITSFSEAVLGTQVDASMTPEEVFKSEYFIEGLLSKCDALFREIPTSLIETSSSITVTFEAVVPNRTTAWREFHSELAVSYSESMLKLHSWAFSSRDAKNHVYFPHTKAPFKQSTFQEPLYWENITISTASNMIADLNMIIHDKFTREEFLIKYHPTNYDRVTDHTFDLEGFVGYVSFVLNDTSRIIYIKLKTTVYYWCHKLKERNIADIAALPESTHEVFPLARVIFYLKNSLPGVLLQISIDLRSSFISYIDTGFVGIAEPKMVEAISKKDLQTQIRAIVNYLYSKEQWNILRSIYGDSFSRGDLFPRDYLASEYKDIESRFISFKGLLLIILCPWKEESIIQRDLEEICDNYGKSQDNPEKSDQSKRLNDLISYLLSK